MNQVVVNLSGSRSSRRAAWFAAFVGLGLVGCESLSTSAKPDADAGGPKLGYRSTGEIQHGKASWYSVRTNRGTRTASGEPLRNDAPTAAHRTLPMGTLVKVTNLRNGASETVRITDRGPFIRGRIIDVTIGTAERLNMVNAGVVPVTVERLERVEPVLQ